MSRLAEQVHPRAVRAARADGLPASTTKPEGRIVSLRVGRQQQGVAQT
jgi:hypothetical protein